MLLVLTLVAVDDARDGHCNETRAQQENFVTEKSRCSVQDEHAYLTRKNNDNVREDLLKVKRKENSLSNRKWSSMCVHSLFALLNFCRLLQSSGTGRA